MTIYTVKHTMQAGGAGWPTAEELIAVLSAMPPTAKPKLELHDSQREGSSWTLTAAWDETTQQKWKPSKPQFTPRAGEGAVPR